MTQPPVPEWSTRLALSIAREVRRYRQAQSLSAQQLSDRCAELGMPIQRSVLANLESGRRTTVTVAEVLVLAAALNIPPGLLVFPVGQAEVVEFLPNERAEALDAVDWFGGIKPLDSKTPFKQNALFLYRRHRALERDLRDQIDRRNAVRAQYVVNSNKVDRDGAIDRLHVASDAYTQARAEADAAAELVREAVAAGDESSAVRTRSLKAEINATQALQNLREAEERVASVTYLQSHLETLDAIVRDRALDLEKVRIDMRDLNFTLPALSDDLNDTVHGLHQGEALDAPADGLLGGQGE